MKVRYKKGKLIIDLLLALAFIGLGVRRLLIGNTDWNIYVLFIIGIGFAAFTLYKFFNPNLIVTETSITQLGPPKKKIEFEDITEATEFSRGYLIKAGKKTIRIGKSAIENSQIEEFSHFFNQYIRKSKA